MGKPIIWSGVNAKLINSGDLIDSKNNSLTNGAKITVTQASHGFTSADVGRPLYLNGSTWTLAQANTAAAAEVSGFIYNVIDANTLRIALSGQIPSIGANLVEGGGNLTAGELYFLSATTAGKITATEPTSVGLISKPIGVAATTTALNAFNMRGSVVGAVNARTQINLSNNTTADVQNMSAYDAGEIVGWIYIDATTDYRFLVKAQFAKNGAATNYNLSYQTVGDTPPAGFSLSVTSAGVIQYTMPNISGFSSSTFNYALNAPAIGTSFPLTVDGSNVTVATTSAQGVVSTTTQSFAGNKTFTGTVNAANFQKNNANIYSISSGDVTITGLSTSTQNKLFTLPNGIFYYQVVSIVPLNGVNDVVVIEWISLGDWSGVVLPTQCSIGIRLGNAVASTSGTIRVFYLI